MPADADQVQCHRCQAWQPLLRDEGGLVRHFKCGACHQMLHVERSESGSFQPLVLPHERASPPASPRSGSPRSGSTSWIDTTALNSPKWLWAAQRGPQAQGPPPSGSTAAPSSPPSPSARWSMDAGHAAADTEAPWVPPSLPRVRTQSPRATDAPPDEDAQPHSPRWERPRLSASTDRDFLPALPFATVRRPSPTRSPRAASPVSSPFAPAPLDGPVQPPSPRFSAPPEGLGHRSSASVASEPPPSLERTSSGASEASMGASLPPPRARGYARPDTLGRQPTVSPRGAPRSPRAPISSFLNPGGFHSPDMLGYGDHRRNSSRASNSSAASSWLDDEEEARSRDGSSSTRQSSRGGERRWGEPPSPRLQSHASRQEAGGSGRQGSVGVPAVSPRLRGAGGGADSLRGREWRWAPGAPAGRGDGHSSEGPAGSSRARERPALPRRWEAAEGSAGRREAGGGASGRDGSPLPSPPSLDELVIAGDKVAVPRERAAEERRQRGGGASGPSGSVSAEPGAGLPQLRLKPSPPGIPRPPAAPSTLPPEEEPALLPVAVKVARLESRAPSRPDSPVAGVAAPPAPAPAPADPHLAWLPPGVALADLDNMEFSFNFGEIQARKQAQGPSSEPAGSSGAAVGSQEGEEAGGRLAPAGPEPMPRLRAGSGSAGAWGGTAGSAVGRPGASLGLSPRPRRRGACAGCGRFVGVKEKCLVCSSKYCSRCLPERMGAMAEGRKCVECVGRPIDEAYRDELGKSKMLRLMGFDSLEIANVNRMEVECAANQLRPEQVLVNGQALSAEQLRSLLSCSRLPRHLQPGSYWYDPVAGLWGELGARPHVRLSPGLALGGPLSRGCSGGSSGVLLNGRELQALELQGMRAAGVQVEAPAELRVDAEGRCGGEREQQLPGSLWDKGPMQVLLPQPPSVATAAHAGPPDAQALRRAVLVGEPGSGCSSFMKQVQLLHSGGFSKEERGLYVPVVHATVWMALRLLLEARTHFSEEEKSGDAPPPGGAPLASPRSRGSLYALSSQKDRLADWVLSSTEAGWPPGRTPPLSFETAVMVDDLWQDPALQAVFDRREEVVHLPSLVGSLLDRVLELAHKDYCPSDEDILLAHGLAQDSSAQVVFSLNNGLGGVDWFEVTKANVTADQSTPLSLPASTQIIMFVVSLSAFDCNWRAEDGQMHNGLDEARKMFAALVTKTRHLKVPLVLLMNQYDSFASKIKQGVPLARCCWFSSTDLPGEAKKLAGEFSPQQAYYCVLRKFKTLYQELQEGCVDGIFSFQIDILKTSDVHGALHFVREITNTKDNAGPTFTDVSLFGDPDTSTTFSF